MITQNTCTSIKNSKNIIQVITAFIREIAQIATSETYIISLISTGKKLNTVENKAGKLPTKENKPLIIPIKVFHKEVTSVKSKSLSILSSGSEESPESVSGNS